MVLLARAALIGSVVVTALAAPATADHCADEPRSEEQIQRCVAEEAEREDDQSWVGLYAIVLAAALALVPLAYYFARKEPLRQWRTEDEAWAAELGPDDAHGPA